MKTYEILTRVEVHDEALLMRCARDQYDRDNGEGTGTEEIQNPGAALDELSHLGDPFLPSGPHGPYDCGVEILGREVREIAPDAPWTLAGTCERCKAPNVVLHVWQPERGGEEHVCRSCLLGLDKPVAPIPGFPVGGTVYHKDGDPTNNDLENLEVRDVPPCFPPQVAQAHAAELRAVLADLLEWRARRGAGGPEWTRAKALMTLIRDEEDAVREGKR